MVMVTRPSALVTAAMPKGEPFPPGAYTLRVSVKGEVETPQGFRRYEVSDTAKVVLTP